MPRMPFYWLVETIVQNSSESSSTTHVQCKKSIRERITAPRGLVKVPLARNPFPIPKQCVPVPPIAKNSVGYTAHRITFLAALHRCKGDEMPIDGAQ